MTTFIQSFIKHESSGGILLIFAMLLAMLMANTVLDQYYHAVLQLPVEVRVGSLQLAKPLLLWINDGLMAVFFFLVGLEVKREVLTGQLSKPEQIVLPGVAAIGGMAVPALVYVFFNMGMKPPCAAGRFRPRPILPLHWVCSPAGLPCACIVKAVSDDTGDYR